MTFAGEDLLKYPADQVVSQLGISHVPEGRRLFGNLTVLENLKLATFARKDKDGSPGTSNGCFRSSPAWTSARPRKPAP